MKHIIDHEHESMTFGKEGDKCKITMESKDTPQKIIMKLDHTDLYNVIGRLLYIQSQIKERDKS